MESLGTPFIIFPRLISTNVTSEACGLSGLWMAKMKAEKDGGKGGDESKVEGRKEKSRQRRKVKWHNIHLTIFYTCLLLHSELRGLLEPKPGVIR